MFLFWLHPDIVSLRERDTQAVSLNAVAPKAGFSYALALQQKLVPKQNPQGHECRISLPKRKLGVGNLADRFFSEQLKCSIHLLNPTK